jgi:peptide/nickel transport system permease protein
MAHRNRVRRYPIPTRRHPPHQPIPILARKPWYRLGSVVAGLAILGTIIVLCLVFPGASKCEPLTMDTHARLQGPSIVHWLGTDQFGRDVGCRTLSGGKISLPVGVVAVAIAVIPGLWLGLLAGYYGNWVDTIIGRLTDLMLAFPGILLTLLILTWLGPGLRNATIAIGLTGIPSYVRLARSATIQLKRKWFIRAAHVVGCTDGRILARHILPNVLPSVIVLATLDVAWAILNATTLSFLGLGAQPPQPEWGSMINEGRGFLREAPWISLAPGIMLTGTILATNLIGDGLRRTLDPRMR